MAANPMRDPLPRKASLHPPGARNDPHGSASTGPRIGAPGPDDDAPPRRPDAVLLDGGDLGPVVRVLVESGARFEHIRVPKSAAPHWPPPRRLLVMSAQLALRLPLPPLSPEDRVIAIALAADGAEGVSAQLARLGFRYRVGPGVHVEALRLLVEQALFRGHEQRQSPRLPLGAEVSWRQGLLRHAGTLVEISREGARLHAPYPLRAGQWVDFEIPGRFARGKRLRVQARILRVEPARSRERTRPHVMALRWMPRGPQEASGLVDLLRECGGGPIAHARPTPGSADARPNAAGEAERRGGPRTPFDREVVTLDAEERVQHALLGHDLSRSGMRVRPHAELRIGQRVRVALYDNASQDALRLDAAVARDDGPRGLVLHFTHRSSRVDARLQAFIAQLPAIQTLQPRPERVVVGQLLRSG